MKVLCLVYLCVFTNIVLAVSSTEEDANGITRSNYEQKKSRTEIDSVIEDLDIVQWEADERPCVEKTLNILYNVKNFTLWAVWIWDSMQPPAGIFYGLKNHLGNYDQCLKPPWVRPRPDLQTQYCLADVKLTDSFSEKQNDDMDYNSSAKWYLQRTSKHGRNFSTITWGSCLPIECRPESVSKILSMLLRRSHLSPLNYTITVASCEKSDNIQYSIGYYLFISMITTLLVTTILSTIFMSIKSDNYTDYKALQSIAKSFDLKRNFNKLTEIKEDDIPAIHTMRALTALVVVHAHQIQLSHEFGLINGLDVEKAFDNSVSLLVRHIEIGIDHFTVISGLLLMKNLMDKEQNLVNFLIKRYIRLLGPVALMIFYFTSVSFYMGNGPLWSRLNGVETEACGKSWWLIPLMLNNYVNTKDMCQLVYWYIPSDFHLAALGVVIFYVFKKNKTLGSSVLLVVSTFSFILPGLITYWKQLPPTMIFDVEKMDFRKNEFFMETYIKTHQRAGRYLIGLAMGYFMSTRKPYNYAWIITEKWSTILAAVNVLFGVFIWVLGSITATRDYDALEASIYVACSNILYAVSLCITFFIFEYGRIPFLSDVIGKSVFVVLSRLSYCIYLVHIAVIQRNIFSRRGPGSYDMVSMIIDGHGVLAITVVISFCLWLIVEAPLASLTNLVLNPRTRAKLNGEVKPKGIQNGVSKNGGLQNGVDIKKEM